MGRFRQELREAALPVAAAELSRRGVTHHVLAGPRWQQTSFGFHRPTGTAEVTPTQRILDATALLPAGAIVAGWAAAYALGVDRLDGRDDQTMRPKAVPVLLPPGLHRESNSVVHYVQQAKSTPLRPIEIREIAGVPVTAVVRTAYDLALWAPDLTEAVVALDAILQARLVTASTLRVRLRELNGRPGARQARRAVELTRSGVRSSWESRLRMFWVLELGLEPPLVNCPVFDREGHFLGAPDLLDEEAGLALEYDGARWRSVNKPTGHRDADQHREDNVREELLERTRLIVVRIDKADLTRYRERLRQRLLDARADGLSRDRTRDRWTIEAPPAWPGLPV